MSQPPITFWYGPVQRFGHPGRPQRWINVLGRIVDPGSVEAVTWTLNNGAERPLALGGDRHRLAQPGDFNVELSWDEVNPGENTLQVTAIAADGNTTSAAMQLIVAPQKTWPLPYRIDFSRVERLQEVAQIVDGLWRLEKTGVRTAIPYYDRVLAMGDSSWTDYQAIVRLTVHGFTPSAPGPPTYNVTHMGVAMRWRGHHTDGLQPRRKWFPLGAQGEFLLNENLNRCRWRILFDGTKEKPHQYAAGHNALVLDQPVCIKTQIATMPDGRSRYCFKEWTDDQPEPPAWDVEGLEADDYPSGALCLVPHNADVTVHTIHIEPLDQPATAGR